MNKKLLLVIVILTYFLVSMYLSSAPEKSHTPTLLQSIAGKTFFTTIETMIDNDTQLVQNENKLHATCLRINALPESLKKSQNSTKNML